MILFKELKSHLGKFEIQVEKDRTVVKELDKNLTWDLSKESDRDDYVLYLTGIYVNLTDDERNDIPVKIVRNIIKYHGGLDHIKDIIKGTVTDRIFDSLELREFWISSDLICTEFIIPLIVGEVERNQVNLIHNTYDLLRISYEIFYALSEYPDICKATYHYHSFTITQIQYGIVSGCHQYDRTISHNIKTFESVTNFRDYYPSQIPSRGKTGNLYYELIRECHRILYRWFNDGDTGSYISDGNFISSCNLYDALHHELSISEMRKLACMIFTIRNGVYQNQDSQYILSEIESSEDYQLNEYLTPDWIIDPCDVITATLIVGEALRKIKESDETFLDRSFDKDLRSELHYLSH